MSNNKSQSTLAELLLQTADLLEEYANICEQQADQIIREMLDK